jgi:hypothetical protein
VYPEASILFQVHLGVRNAGIEDYIEDATSIVAQGNQACLGKHAISFLKKINQMAGNDPSPQVRREIRRLSAMKIFPVRQPPRSATTQTWTSSQELLDHTSTWYIPDRFGLQEAFEGKVPMLDIDQDKVNELMHIVGYLGFKNRLMSNAAETVVRKEGDRHEKLQTAEMREKLKVILK